MGERAVFIAALIFIGLQSSVFSESIPKKLKSLSSLIQEKHSADNAKIVNLSKSDPLGVSINMECIDKTASFDFQNFCSAQELIPVELLQKRAEDPCMRMAFSNPGLGVLHSGLCWWHSIFQANAWMLARFLPDRPRVSIFEIYQRLNRLYKGRDVVEFPGFHNWQEISLAYSHLIVDLMLKKQALDVFHPEVWGSWFMKPPNPKKIFQYGKMIEENYKKGLPTFIYLKQGRYMHSKIVAEVTREENRLKILFVDSNDELTTGNQYSYSIMEIKEIDSENALQTNDIFDSNVDAWKPSTRTTKNIASAWKKYCKAN